MIAGLVLLFPLAAATPVASQPAMELAAPGQVRLGGLLGEALEESLGGRLTHFIVDENSPALRLFSPQGRAANTAGVYWGEHAGKWLYAASRAASRTGDPVLTARVRRAADYLLSVQEPDGYLGTYPEALRFTHPQGDDRKKWDVWTLSYAMLGLLETNKYFPDPSYVNAARRIADLCRRTFDQGRIKITDCGNHHGLSATVLLDPVVELYFATGSREYLDFAESILRAADDQPSLRLVPSGLAGDDVQKVGDGKIYQLCWNLVGVAKLAAATGDPKLLRLVQRDWEDIRRHHLTIEGGPWGGVGVPREEFDPPGFFSPYGFVETCSTMAWIQLNRELLRLTGEARYADEIERSAYNALLGAQDPDGEDWCYYTFPNGRRTNTAYWSCCKSSGAMALEELPPIAYGLENRGRDVAVNLYGPGRAVLQTSSAGPVVLRQVTDYPFSGDIRLLVSAERRARFRVLLRVPSWAAGASIRVDGVPLAPGRVVPEAYAEIDREWGAGDEIDLRFPMVPVLHEQANRSVHGVFPLGAEEAEPQEVTRYDYAAVSRGPLVYATGLIDGFKREETVLLPGSDAASRLKTADAPAGFEGPAISLRADGRSPIVFVPYYEAGGRRNQAWRFTWMQFATEGQ